MLKAHLEKIHRIADALKQEATAKGHLSLKKAAVSHVVPNPNDPKHSDRKVNIRDLKTILKIDAKHKLCIAEPGVTFCELVAETLKVGLVPYLVPELKTITVGGAVSGCSVESLSYRHGGFHDSCLEYEVITAAGHILTCSPQQYAELFHMMHGSYGTLGILSKLTFKLMDAKPFVKMTYRTYPSIARLLEAMTAHRHKKDVEFMDAIVHAPDQAVLCLGHFVDDVPYTSDYTFLNIFYKSTRTRQEDYLSTTDYLFRYDTECHWMTRTLPGMETKLLRFLLGKFLLSSTNLLKWSQRLRSLLRLDKRPDVVVDVFIPPQAVDRFCRFYQDKINYYPLWIVPYQSPAPYPWINDTFAKHNPSGLFFDFAIYGLRNTRRDTDYYQLIEDEVFACKGFKTLISHNRYTRETFWKIYNRPNYQAVKSITDPTNRFRDLYEKVNF